MGLQGSRWGWLSRMDTYTSTTTFDSYGVTPGDREGMLAAMPEHHKAFLSELDWVCEIQTPHGLVIAVHAGFACNVSGREQIEMLKKKDWTIPRVLQFSGRQDVYAPPTDIFDENVFEDRGKDNVFLVSGHHHTLEFLGANRRRIIVDSCAGKASKKLSAVLLPSLEIITDMDHNK